MIGFKTISKLLIIIFFVIITYLLYNKFFLPKPLPNQFENVIKVTSQKALYHTIEKIHKLPAKVFAYQELPILAEVSGKITEIFFKEGSKVSKNQLLMKFDEQINAAAYRHANSNLKHSEVHLKRFLNLSEKKIQTQRSYEEAMINYEKSKANYAKAKHDLDNTSVLAPIDGIISLSNINPGQYISTNEKLFTIYNFEKLRGEFSIQPEILPLIKIGDKIEFKINHNILLGHISSINPVINPENNMIQIIALIDNFNFQITSSNIYAQAYLKNKLENILLVDESAIISEKENGYVYTIKDNKAWKTPVKLGLRYKNYIQVTEGLKADEIIIIKGQINLFDGANILNNTLIEKID